MPLVDVNLINEEVKFEGFLEILFGVNSICIKSFAAAKVISRRLLSCHERLLKQRVTFSLNHCVGDDIHTTFELTISFLSGEPCFQVEIIGLVAHFASIRKRL